MGGRMVPAPGLDQIVAETFARPAVEQARDKLVSLAKEGAPVVTGRLQQTIHGGPVRVRGARVTAEVEAHAIDPGTGYDYAGATEFGRRDQAPNPYMRRAAQRVRDEGPGQS